MISGSYLREILVYQPETGKFFWKSPRPKIVVGTRAGHKSPISGYNHIRIDRKLYRAARLAVLYMTDAWPIVEVDHINRVRDDDRWANLREATKSENMSNRVVPNVTGFKGVYPHKKSGLFRAEIKRKSLGYYKTPDAAYAAIVAAQAAI